MQARETFGEKQMMRTLALLVVTRYRVPFFHGLTAVTSLSS